MKSTGSMVIRFGSWQSTMAMAVDCASVVFVAIVTIVALGADSYAQVSGDLSVPIVEMSSGGPMDTYIDGDILLGPPPPPATPWGGGMLQSLSNLQPMQWLQQTLQAPVQQLDAGIVDGLLSANEPFTPGVWPAPDGVAAAGVSGGLLGLRGALQVASQGTTQVLPDGLIFRPYLAGPKESRLGTQVFYDAADGWLFDNTLGTRVGLIRWGTDDPVAPQGIQIDLEASAQLRIDLEDDLDVRSNDYRAGIPVTFGFGRHRSKLAYYHLSSHLGDEFLLKTGTARVNYSRDVLLFGHAVYLSPALRVYGEAGWAFLRDVGGPWELQFGADYAPARGTGPGGAPFFGVNGYLREELNYGGTLTAQVGWAWRSHRNGRLLRMGAHYLNGASPQFSFLGVEEQQIGFGIWLDN